MNRMIRFLADFCGEHVLDEKLFLVPSYSAGHQIGQSLARTAGSWVNLRFLTFPALASEISAVDLEAEGKSELTETEALALADGLFRELKAGKKLRYFHRLEPVPGVVEALYEAVQSLRSAGIGPGDLRPASFRVGSKGEDLNLILRHYEELLERKRALDRPGLLSFALDRWSRRREAPGGEAWILCPRDRRIGRLERELARAVGGGKLVLVPGDPVFGLDRPNLVWEDDAASEEPPPTPASDAERLPWLFSPRSAPEPFGDGTLSLFRAVGPTNECREVLRRILAANIPFDEVEVIHPPGEVHAAAFHLLAEKERIPATFAEGIPVAFTTVGRAFSGLADWIGNGFLVRDLCDLVRAGDFVFPWKGEDTPPSPEAIFRHLMGAGIVRGRERYLDRLEALKGGYEASLSRKIPGEDDEKTAESTASLRRSIREIDRLAGAVRDLLAVFSGIESSGGAASSDFRLLSEGLARVIRDSVPAKTELDGIALETVLSRIREAGADAGGAPSSGTLPVAESLDRLRALVLSLSVGASTPLPGHLHVSGMRSGGFSGRPVTFLVGLGETGVSGRGLQDPILLDGERREISPELPTSTDRLRQDLHSLAVLLSSLRGRVVLSYSSYDILEERAAFPSSLVLQAHRLIRGDPDLDYSDLDSSLPEAAGFLPNEPSGVLDETDWWFFRLGRGGRFPDGLDVVRDNFPELRDGLAAVEARNGETLTAHEGIVRIDPGRHDPVTNHGIVLSASRLEQLAKCPYGYFLRYVLKIEPPERLEFDPSRWLDPKQRGLLIHEVLCEFMSEVRERGEAVDPGRHRPLMEETADRVVDSWRRSIPPPSEAIFAGERKEVRETLDVFLVSESRREEEVEPLEFEKRFAGVEIPVGRGRTFLLRGVIDRIDRVGPGAYRIVDYKTGSPGPFERLVTFGGGRIIQHALYAVAAEDLLRREAKDPRPRVTESGYYFPTRRGEGREIMVRDFDREALRRLLADMLDLVARGYFLAGPRTECERCDLSSVCGGAAEARRDKSETDRDVFEAYERLKRYE